MSTVRKFQPHYTVADYQHWEGDWELWYGTAIAMSPSPFGPHERAVAKFVAQIDSSVTNGKCDCAVYAGLDWIVQNDTVVRPDVMIVCGNQPIRHLEKPPVLAIEVLSESTATKDNDAKRELYENQRVEHYLIADTAERFIRWFALQSSGEYRDTSNSIPDDGLFSVSLSDGCVIHFDRKGAFA
jgi:Uma2 family endonuclease